MPSQKQIEDAAARRAERKAAKEAAVQKAHDEAQEVAQLSEKQSKDPAAKAAAAPRAPAKSRKQIVAEKRKAAEKQADEDVRRVKEEVNTDLTRFRERGETPSLHVLNAMAQASDRQMRNEAREIANAAGKAAFDVATGMRANHGVERRYQKMAREQAAMDKARAAKQAEQK